MTSFSCLQISASFLVQNLLLPLQHTTFVKHFIADHLSSIMEVDLAGTKPVACLANCNEPILSAPPCVQLYLQQLLFINVCLENWEVRVLAFLRQHQAPSALVSCFK